MSQRHARKIHTTLLIALPLALVTITPAAHALQMDATASWNYNPVPGGSDSAGPASSGYVDIIGMNYDPGNTSNSVFYHTYGDDSGNFGSRTSGTGSFDITGQYSFSQNYIASGGTALFDFHIVPGELAFYNTSTLTASEQLTASYQLDIRLNGTSIWSSGATLNQTGSTISFSPSGTALGSYAAGSNAYAIDPYNGSLILNNFITLNAGDIFTIEYDLTTTAFSNQSCTGIPQSDIKIGDAAGGANGQIVKDANGHNKECASVIARIGDPFGVNDLSHNYPDSSSTKITGANVVPEPGTIALLGLGLAGLGYSRRRKV